MSNKKKTKILIAGERVERFNYNLKALKDICDIEFSNKNECISLCTTIKNLTLILFQKRVLNNYCVNHLKNIKWLMPQTPIVVLCEDISKETAITLFRYGIRDILERSFNEKIRMDEIIPKINFAFAGKPKTREQRFNYLLFMNMPSGNGNYSHKDERVEKVKKHIEENYKSELKLKDIAKLACTSKCNFCKIFKKYYGCSFKQYLCKVRIEKSIELLRNTSLSISEIAFEVGFNSLSHFTSLFREELKIPPASFRKNIPFIPSNII